MLGGVWRILGFQEEEEVVPKPSSPDDFRQLFDEKTLLLYSLESDPRWTPIEYYEADGSVSTDIELSDLIIENNALSFVRARTTLSTSAEALFKLVQANSLDDIKQFDRDMSTLKLIEEIQTSPLVKVFYITYNAPMGVATREFLIAHGGKKDEKGNYISLSTSIEYKDTPVESGNVRGNLHVGGWIITPIDEKSCRCSRLAQVNPKGWIPPFVVNMVKHKAAEGLVDIRQLVRDGKM
eukprot:TRINITY_DN11071_c0_g1_i1.p1 TRINITY_DN11071_c0_g1~~TRINITY_DN11071_c0_g1_i1.p1  ORF type:complete len:238 (+),score=54.61 TRINITY_DN11071_c0_g1_i1:44-757(+)